MNARVRVRRLGAVGAVVLAASLAGCGLLPVNRAGSTRMLTLPAASSSVLVIITDQGTPKAMKITGTLLSESARAGEHVIVLGDRGGALLASSTAPAPPSVQAPEPPAPLPADPTSFQKARYNQAVQQYQEELQQARQSLQEPPARGTGFLGAERRRPGRIPREATVRRRPRTSPPPWGKQPRIFPACGSPVVAPRWARPLSSSASTPPPRCPRPRRRRTCRAARWSSMTFPAQATRRPPGRLPSIKAGASRAVILTPATEQPAHRHGPAGSRWRRDGHAHQRPVRPGQLHAGASRASPAAAAAAPAHRHVSGRHGQHRRLHG